MYFGGYFDKMCIYGLRVAIPVPICNTVKWYLESFMDVCCKHSNGIRVMNNDLDLLNETSFDFIMDAKQMEYGTMYLGSIVAICSGWFDENIYLLEKSFILNMTWHKIGPSIYFHISLFMILKYIAF